LIIENLLLVIGRGFSQGSRDPSFLAALAVETASAAVWRGVRHVGNAGGGPPQTIREFLRHHGGYF
jgi:hypothetical protein